MVHRILPFVVIFILFTGCNWFKKPSQSGKMLSEFYNDKRYLNFDTVEYSLVFRKVFDSLSREKQIGKWYRSRGDEPVLVNRFLRSGQLDSLIAFAERSEEHGIPVQRFQCTQLKQALQAVKNHRYDDLASLYKKIAELEIASSRTFLRYIHALQYGIIEPRKYLTRFTIPAKRPDSLSTVQILESASMISALQHAQPKSPAYLFMMERLRTTSAENERNLLLVNMERLRWKLPDMGSNYIQINIPDFKLVWVKNHDTLLTRKVCVGAKREENFDEKIRTWLITRKLEDMPRNHETTILVSELNAIDVNPVWNIPVSIAQSEIYFLASKDPYYLSDNNIHVYKQNKRILDPDTIQWSKYNREKLPFRFSQGAGDGNALGKFKFLFPSKSNIYLHDTNNKNGFALANRAISHGCVRVEQPLELAQLLLNDAARFDELRTKINLPPLDSLRKLKYNRTAGDSIQNISTKRSWFSVSPKVKLIINYTTAWVERGKLEIRPDVYGHDAILLRAIRK